MRVEIFRFMPEDWERLEDSLMEIEDKCYSGSLQYGRDLKKELIASGFTVAFLAKVGDKVVGESYGIPVEDLDMQPGFKSLVSKYKEGDKAFCHMAFAVLPEYQNMGIGKSLKKALMMEAKKQGYRFLIGHAKEGVALEINKKFGARTVKSYRNWGNSGNIHYLYEIDLGSFCC